MKIYKITAPGMMGGAMCTCDGCSAKRLETVEKSAINEILITAIKETQKSLQNLAEM